MRPVVSIISAPDSRWHVRCSTCEWSTKEKKVKLPVVLSVLAAGAEAFKCGQCGRRFGSQEQLQQHEKECVPARVK